MRTRLVRPAFWTDSKVARLPDSTRLFYIGLWCVADDAGYLEWDLPQLTAELMPYKAPAEREAQAEEDARILAAAGRIELLPCGQHALIPKLEEHRIAGGSHSSGVANDHRASCLGALPVPPRKDAEGRRRTSPDESRSESVSESESESVSTRAPARKGSMSPKDPTPMTTARAEATLADSDASPEARAGARAYLELAATWATSRPGRRAEPARALS